MRKTVASLFLLPILALPCSSSAATFVFLFGDKDGFGTSTAPLPDGTPFTGPVITEPDDFPGTDWVGVPGDRPDICCLGISTISLTFDSFSPNTITSVNLLIATANVADDGPSGTDLFENDFLSIDGVDVPGAFDGINQDAPDVTGSIVFSSEQSIPDVTLGHSGTFPLPSSFFSSFEDGAIDLTIDLRPFDSATANGDGIFIDFIELQIQTVSGSALACYEITPASGEPPFDEREVIIWNQFGTQGFTVVKPETLCVPSELTELP